MADAAVTLRRSNILLQRLRDAIYAIVDADTYEKRIVAAAEAEHLTYAAEALVKAAQRVVGPSTSDLRSVILDAVIADDIEALRAAVAVFSEGEEPGSTEIPAG